MVKLNELKEMAGGERIQLNELPQEFIGVIVNEEMRTDRTGRQALFWDIQLENGKIVTQKFTKLHLNELAQALEKLGITDTQEAIGKKLKFRQQVFRQGFPRWLPIELVK